MSVKSGQPVGSASEPVHFQVDPSVGLLCAGNNLISYLHTNDRQAVTCFQCQEMLQLTDTVIAELPTSAEAAQRVRQQNAVKPAHYMVGDPYEHVKVVRAWGLNYELGCATKYLARAGKKDKAKHIEDLRKSIRYIEMEIERLEAEKPGE